MYIARKLRACFHGVVRGTQTTNHFASRLEEGEGLGLRSNTRLDQRRSPTFDFVA